MARVDSEPEELEAQASAIGVPSEVIGRTPWQIFWGRFLRDRFAVAGVVVIIIIILLAIFAGWIADNVVHHGPNDFYVFEMTTSAGIPKGPNKAFWFGADNAGQDLFVRVLYGARTSLIIAFGATLAEVVIGVAFGIVAGFFGGKVDTVLSRFTDVVLSLPVLLLALGLVSACGIPPAECAGGLIKPGLPLVAGVIALFSWPYLSRIVRGQVLSIREKEFVEASRAMGASSWWIMRKEIFPNVVAPIIVYTTLLIPTNILFEAALSYLGVGVPRSVPSWGRQLSDATSFFEVAWWMMLFPGVFLLLTTLAFNLVGDGLRDALDPRAASMSYRRQHRRRIERKERKASAELVEVSPLASP